MLRAIVSVDQLESLLAVDSTELLSIGCHFPDACHTPITLIEISQQEATAKWPAGYCRVANSPMEFDERLRLLPEPNIPESPKRETRRSGLGLFHWLKRDTRSGV